MDSCLWASSFLLKVLSPGTNPGTLSQMQSGRRFRPVPSRPAVRVQSLLSIQPALSLFQRQQNWVWEFCSLSHEILAAEPGRPTVYGQGSCNHKKKLPEGCVYWAALVINSRVIATQPWSLIANCYKRKQTTGLWNLKGL